MIKRYAEVPNSNGLGYSNGLAEDESGAWVSLDDYEALEAKNRELALQILATDGQAQEALARAVAAEAKLAEAVEALEPFADIAEHHAADAPEWDDGDTVPAIVRIGALRAALAKIKGDAE